MGWCSQFNRWLVCWEDSRTGDIDIYCEILDENGATYLDAFPVDGSFDNQFDPDIACFGDTCQVVYEDQNNGNPLNRDIRVANVSMTTGLYGVNTVSEQPEDEVDPSIALSGSNRFVIAWGTNPRGETSVVSWRLGSALQYDFRPSSPIVRHPTDVSCDLTAERCLIVQQTEDSFPGPDIVGDLVLGHSPAASLSEVAILAEEDDAYDGRIAGAGIDGCWGIAMLDEVGGGTPYEIEIRVVCSDGSMLPDSPTISTADVVGRSQLAISHNTANNQYFVLWPELDFSNNLAGQLYWRPCIDADEDGVAVCDGQCDGNLPQYACTDSADDDPLVCVDSDGDLCDDCSSGAFDPSQDGADTDGDTICDAGDNCPDDANLDQDDGDGDGVGDACDDCPDDPDKTEPEHCGCGNPETDTDSDDDPDCIDPDDDNDGVSDANEIADGSDPLDPNQCGDADLDTCDDCSVGVDGFGPLDDSNPWNDGPDGDGDGTCDATDGCPEDPEKTAPGVCGCGVTEDVNDTDMDGDVNCLDPDDDNDGVADGSDPATLNPNLCGDSDADTCDDCTIGVDGFGLLPDGVPANDGPDSDGDGACDPGDGCPLDPNKTDPGACGCGEAESDADADGTPDCVDGCPLDPLKIAPGTCGCGVPDEDVDSDGLLDCLDSCLDGDADGYGDPGLGGNDCAGFDCNDADDQVWEHPDTATNLVMHGDKVTLAWDSSADPGGAVVSYDVIGSDRADSFFAHACVESDDTDLVALDPYMPPGDGIRYYLVRAENGCGAAPAPRIVGGPGSGPGQFDGPSGIALGPSGRLYVGEYSQHRIHVLDSAGQFLFMFGWGVDTGTPQLEVCDISSLPCFPGQPGPGTGQIWNPQDVAIAPQGDVYVANRGGNRILVFDGDGEYLAEFGSAGTEAGEFANVGPYDLHVDQRGWVYASDPQQSRLQVFDDDHNFRFMLGWGVDTNAAEFEVCTDNSLPCHPGIEGDGAGQFSVGPAGVAVTPSGSIVVGGTRNNRIQVFEPNGAFAYAAGWGVDTGLEALEVCDATTLPCHAGIPGPGDGQFQNARTVEVDATGKFYVVELAGDRIQVFDSERLAASYCLSPSKDNTIFEEHQDYSNGSGGAIFSGRSGNNHNYSLRRALIAFDVAGGLPDGFTASHVVLSLAVNNLPQQNPVPQEFSLHRVTEDWGEGPSATWAGVGVPAVAPDATWSHRFWDDSLWSSLGGAFDPLATATQQVPGQYGTFSWTSQQMVEDVQSWLETPSSNFGWILVGDEGGTPRTFRGFASREYDDLLALDSCGASGLGPKLVIRNDGRVLSIDGSDTADGGPLKAKGLAIGPLGRLFVSEPSKDRIQILPRFIPDCP
ncbi:MAG: DNRLRE domain-containing protein [bacterium]|nr:DNRLRE domain-containing protein [bacterium]